MIRIGIVEIKEKNAIFNTEELWPRVKEKITNTKDEGERTLRYAAYKLLYKILKEEYFKDESMPEILYTGEGKPYIAGKDGETMPSISLSHDRNFALAAVCDGTDIGVDVQGAPKIKASLERAVSRFLLRSGTREENECREIPAEELSFCFFDIKNGEVVSKKSGLPLSRTSYSLESLTRWTVFESLLKLSGKGLSGNSEIESVKAGAAIAVYKIKRDGTEYAISVAKSIKSL